MDAVTLHSRRVATAALSSRRLPNAALCPPWVFYGEGTYGECYYGGFRPAVLASGRAGKVSLRSVRLGVNE